MGREVKRKRTAEAILARSRAEVMYQIVRDAKRAEETRALVGFKYLRGDPHVHTVYSDGFGSVAEVAETGKARGLDFMFVTDHGTVRQKVECAKHPGVWWGQEPGAGKHHIGILNNAKKYTPCRDMRRDAERLRKLGCFFWYPHPTGWFPRTHYDDERMYSLREVDGPIAMEVVSGIYRTEPAHDEWIDRAVALWDELLCEGRRVTGLAATDSHYPTGVGNVWTGVLNTRRVKTPVINALRSGNVFASLGPAINLTSGGTPMGGTARPRAGKATITVECADSRGLHWLRLVQDGRVAREFHYRDGTHCTEQVTLRVRKSGGYIRAECASMDNLRAYANPIYVAPAR